MRRPAENVLRRLHHIVTEVSGANWVNFFKGKANCTSKYSCFNAVNSFMSLQQRHFNPAEPGIPKCAQPSELLGGAA